MWEPHPDWETLSIAVKLKIRVFKVNKLYSKMPHSFCISTLFNPYMSVFMIDMWVVKYFSINYMLSYKTFTLINLK